MISVLIIADDFTGALDTGAQFQRRGIRTSVTTSADCDFACVDSDVLAVDAQTRHIAPEKAKRCVYEIVKRARDAGIPYIYKKTDSVMRGNIGAELEGALEASGETSIYLVPAYPKSGRTTVGGVQYLNGVPVARSVFGRDPFEPVRYSDLSDLLGQQTDIPIRKVSVGDLSQGRTFSKTADREIVVVDAETDEDLRMAASVLSAKGPKLLAGCAGFAEMLPELWELPAGTIRGMPRVNGFVICSGSLSPVTFRQINNAVSAGFSRYTLTDEQRLADQYTATEAFQTWLKSIRDGCSGVPRLIVEGEDSTLERSRLSADQDNEQIRQKVANNLGAIYSEIIRSGLSDFYVIVGGDTFLSILNHLKCRQIIPIGEISPGVVLSSVQLDGKQVYLASKAGGLGTLNVFVEIESRMSANAEGGGGYGKRETESL